MQLLQSNMIAFGFTLKDSMAVGMCRMRRKEPSFPKMKQSLYHLLDNWPIFSFLFHGFMDCVHFYFLIFFF